MRRRRAACPAGHLGPPFSERRSARDFRTNPPHLGVHSNYEANQEIQRANQDQQDILEAVENAKNEVENY